LFKESELSQSIVSTFIAADPRRSMMSLYNLSDWNENDKVISVLLTTNDDLSSTDEEGSLEGSEL